MPSPPLVHGFVGGYLPPVLGDTTRQIEAIPDFTFEAGMTVVVQPNVVTKDESAGFQTGELLLVCPDGAKRLHDFECEPPDVVATALVLSTQLTGPPD